jgi:ATP-dependent Lon protease
MTGEVTLRGKNLPIGGLRKNCWQPGARIKNIILPKQNEKDLVDVPKDACVISILFL